MRLFIEIFCLTFSSTHCGFSVKLSCYTLVTQLQFNYNRVCKIFLLESVINLHRCVTEDPHRNQHVFLRE